MLAKDVEMSIDVDVLSVLRGCVLWNECCNTGGTSLNYRNQY